ncbi:hypothetical protein C2G38_2174392 [Gigaspora rosea]|uniref:Uncharacterized protein n=1 Tax=Gigaspora rosea TaxID=44941 RepID=A0A397VKB2_9GLOM|nr:hypothetical protein C2G38_2174392 [Gigaspora rosea]
MSNQQAKNSAMDVVFIRNYEDFVNKKEIPSKILTIIPEVTEAPKVTEANPNVSKDPELAEEDQKQFKIIKKPKFCDKNESVMAPFKPPIKPNSPLFNSYRKNKRSLSDIIIIKLPTSTSPQTYNLNITFIDLFDFHVTVQICLN